MYEVTVLDDGYLWNGSKHTSLSTIARLITGTHWNGWRFFGIDQSRSQQAKAKAAKHGCDPQKTGMDAAVTTRLNAVQPEQGTVLLASQVDLAQISAAQRLVAHIPDRYASSAPEQSLMARFTGLIFDSNGNRMSPTRANKRGVRYRYYTSRALAEGRKADVGNPARVSAPVIEAAVLDAIRGNIDSNDTGSAIKALEPPSDDTLVATHLRRVVVHADKLTLEICGSIHPASASDTIDPATEKETMAIRNLIVSWSPEQKRPKQVIMEAGGTLTGNADADDNRRRLAHAIQSGRNWLAELASGSTESIDHIAIREGKHLRTIRTTIALAFLEPDMTEQLISHGLPAHWTLSDVARRLPRLWSDQRKMLAN
jgi:hypothetical protein